MNPPYAREQFGPRAQLAWDTILRRQVKGISTWLIHVMEHEFIDRIAAAPPGSYVKDPERVYLEYLHNLGACMVDQFIPENPLSMGRQGYNDGAARHATTGAEAIVVDGMPINSPEDVVAHMERFSIPAAVRANAEFDEDACVDEIVRKHDAIQQKYGPNILKTGYGEIRFPGFRYGAYGYTNYFMAFALYPDVMERYFSAVADGCLLVNRAVVRAASEANLPLLWRLDHDMADSRGTLVRIEDLDRLWFPHFARCLDPVLKSDIKMIWHCDGNLMAMVPRLLDVGLDGFQGFQYEDGMDYEKICRMKTRDGDDLIVIGGVSVTTTLPSGTPNDVKRALRWLVENGPKTGLFLAATSSIAPGVPWENIKTLIDGFAYYRENGRG